MQLTNVKIEEAKKVKEGTGDRGPWELWRLTIDGKQFIKFRTGGENLEAGREIALAEYEVKEQTKNGVVYKNLSITKLVWADSPMDAKTDNLPPMPTKAPVIEIPDSMLFSYIKDMDNAAVSASPEKATVDLETRAKSVARVFLIVKDVLRGEEIPF